MSEIEEWQRVEGEALRRFRAKATEIRSAHPDWSQQFCFSKAVESLPRSAEKYLYVTQRLRMAGITLQPLR
jgi:hypothetical protein